MNNKIILIIVLAGIVIGGLYFFTQKQYQPSQMQTATQQSTAQQPQTTVETNTVTIQNFAFNPGTLTVKQGATVTWTNQDSAPHKIKSDTFNSPSLSQGDTFKFVFATKGSYEYSCSIHPSMTGKIVVE
jgi:plastocyanin